jgi:peptidyl-prolyl cis-trans isomerase D
VFSLDNRYVIAKLVSIQEAGVTNPTGEVKASVETIIRNEKKAALLLEKYKNASSLEAVANASKQAVLNADSVNFANPFSANLGFEPKVIGYAFSDQLKLNTVSKPIKGADGLVYMMVTNRLSANKVPNPIEIMQQRVTTDMQTKNYISGKLEDIFLQGGTIKYNVNVLY